MTARAFLVRGLLAGLLAGFATFLVAYTVGESHVQAAINLEEANAAAVPDPPSEGAAGFTASPALYDAHGGGEHDEDGTVVSRHNQRTWGLLTGSVGLGTALGGLVGLVSAGLVGRVGRLRPAQTTTLVAVVGYVSVALVPFLKYPASPPAVGNPDTIGMRTGTYFAYMLISVLAAIAATALAERLWKRYGAYVGVLAGVGTFLVVVVVAGQLMPTVNELGDFPADTLWYFRRASMIVQATMWATIGVALTGFVLRLQRETSVKTERRELAASL